MPPAWYASGTLYKGLFFLVVVLLAIQYLFGTINNNNKQFFIFNATSKSLHPDAYQSRPIITSHNSAPMLIKSTTIKQVVRIQSINQTNNTNISRDSFITTNTSLHKQTPLSNFTNEITKIFESTQSSDNFDGKNSTNSTANSTQFCPEVAIGLRGRIPVMKWPVPSITELEERFNWLKTGGHWAPETCRVEKSVAIVVPFRCRGEHLLLFLQHMHPFLKSQQLDYTIFIIEQEGDGPFNRAMLMNVGFNEALKLRPFDCFIFHDIDLLPEDDRNMYSCPPGQPRHMSVAVDIFQYRLPYPAIFGGVSAISTKHFLALNGFSNSFWGWGGEDDDMSNRIRYHNLYISRYPMTIARYTMLTHKKDKPSPNRFEILKQGPKRFDKDGLKNLQYRIVLSKRNLLYSWLLVGIDPPS